MGNRVTHFEIPNDHPDKAMKFFESVFHWSFNKFPDEDYWYAVTGIENDPGINGAIMKKRDPNQPITNTISVSDIDKTIERIEKEGGTIVVPKMAIPYTGWQCFFKDPDGNILGIFQDDELAK